MAESSTDPQTQLPTDSVLEGLSQEELLELEKLKKRAERFGTPFDAEKLFSKTATKPKSAEKPKPLDDKLAEEERKKIEEREKKFGIVVTKPRNDKHFEQKLEHVPGEDNKLRPEAIHVFGVDFLSTDDIMGYFKAYGPQKLEWINDSSCNVVFESENNAQEALIALTLTKSYDTNWRESFPVKKEELDYVLQLRQATEKDIKQEDTSGRKSKYYRYMIDQYIEKKKERQENMKGRNRNNRDYYDDRRGVMRKKISKNRRGKRSNDDKEEDNDKDIKDLRKKQEQEAAQEGEQNEKETQDNGEQNQNYQDQGNDGVQAASNKEQAQDQDLDL